VARQDGFRDLRHHRHGAGPRRDRRADVDGHHVWGFADTSTWQPHLLAPIEISAAVGGVVALALRHHVVLASHPGASVPLVHSTDRVFPRRLRSGGDLASPFSSGFAVAL
jgi:hypothetical protein